MRPFESTISFEEAQRILHGAAIPLDRTERVSLDSGQERVLAADVLAPRDVPGFDRAAMDGYAVRARDTRGASRAHPVPLQLLGRVYAGETADVPVETNTCIEIATGAPIPDGADAVVMVEDTSVSGPSADGVQFETKAQVAAADADAGLSHAADAAGVDRAHARGGMHADAAESVSVGRDVQIFAEARPSQHIIRRGADMLAGDVLLARGAQLTASRLGALAAVGIPDVDVFSRPVVAILPTGDELTPVGAPLPLGHVYDVNRYTLASVVRQHGGVPRVYPTVADNLDAVRSAISRIIQQGNGDSREPVDLLVLTGGSSVGEHDLVIDILREQGDVLFHGIAVKPGKPTALARIGRLLVLGMPGNPTSCLSNAYVLLIPLLRATGRLPVYQPKTVRATLAADVESPRDRYQFMPVRLEDGRAIPTFKGSGEITSLSRADGYFEIPTHVTRLDAGTQVEVTLY
jgi:molybdopterin molybdotransferase